VSRPSFFEYLFFVLALLIALAIQGAIPFVFTPTLGQAVWTTGFSHSFVNGGLFEIYAHNIGAPEPAPMAFGLAGAWPASLLIRFGLHAADAYAAMVALWLSLAFVSAYTIARHFQANRYYAIIAALCWLSMPMIWEHARYSMLSLGIGLLSFYFLVVIKLVDTLGKERRITAWMLLYPIACIISVFMDGYSFMMFATGSSVIVAMNWFVLKNREKRKRWILVVFPIHVFSFTVSYVLYAAYIGQPSFESHSLDAFRGWGADLTFFAVPTYGMHWLPDLLGWSTSRTAALFWGDASVWITTFCLPLIVGALWAVMYVRKNKAWILIAGLIALFGFYMALGPSLKINTVKSPEAIHEQLMDSKHAIAPTGSAWISANLPGFNVMRASYRWAALGVFFTWLIIVIALSKSQTRRTVTTAGLVLAAITLLNLPSPLRKWTEYRGYHSMFFEIDRDILEPLSKDVAPNEKVAFLPWRNDFLVNYLASKLNIISFNIGGDKNYQMARENWPETLRGFPMGKVDSQFANRVLTSLASGHVDVIVFPYIDMLWAAHAWPRKDERLRSELGPVVEFLVSSGMVDVSEREHYALVRLKRESTAHAAAVLKEKILNGVCLLPDCLRVNYFGEQTPTGTGSIINGVLHSTGEQGFMLFGPYQPMNAGKYSFVMYGTVKSASGSWVDVVSEKGAALHRKWELTDTVNATGALLDTAVELKQSVQDLEVRVYAGTDSQIVVKGYELRLISPNHVTP